MNFSRPAAVRTRQLLLLVLLPLCLSFLNHSAAEAAGWVQSPASRNDANSLHDVNLTGFVDSPNQTITFTVVDQNSGNPVALVATATSEPAGMSYATSSGSAYTLYAWHLHAGVLEAKYWAPQFQNPPAGSPVPNLATSQGRLEIAASGGGTQLSTFSHAALELFLASSADPRTAAAMYADGTSTVLFAQDGVGSGRETSWVNVQGMVSTPPPPPSPPYLQVAWSVGSYSVEGGAKKIYALVCSPSSGGPYPVVIFNHGGLFTFNGGNVSGMVTSAGWTSGPAGEPDGLGQCIDWAKRGWVFATSSYRGESIKITSSSTDFAGNTWTSGGYPELCLGEVTDVLALTDLIVNRASSISVGSPGAQVPLNVNKKKVLMYGYSHGGCVTYRAVEQGAPVTAFAVIEGFTDFILGYLNGLDYLTFGPAHEAYQGAALAAAQGSFAFTPTGVYYPDTNGVMGYNWRSAHYFASRGDLSIQKFKTMPILIFHGDVDFYVNPNLPSSANPVYLNEATELAADINAASIFVGPTGSSPPASEPCMSGPVGAPIPDGLAGPTGSCPVAFMPMDTGDGCMTFSATALPFNPGCVGLPLPLTPLQPHYLVVYDKMDHVNGGLAIKNTFSGFVLTNFGAPPGCNGLEIQCN
jgi:hypothetical protein